MNAMLNAAPNSNVGQLNTLREEMIETEAAYDAWSDAYQDYVTLRDSYDGRTSEEIEGEIGALDTSSATYDDDLAALEAELNAALAHEAELGDLASTSNEFAAEYEAAQAEEEEALLTVTRGRELSDEALEELRNRLTN
jgi:chromosome segregation ATPase